MNRRTFFSGALGAGGYVLTSRAAVTGDASGIDRTLSTGIERRKIPCAVGMVASGGTTLYSGAYGKRDQDGPAVTINSIFAIASMTKAVTTVAALQLVEQGKVTLTEPVSKYLPKLEKLDVLDGFETGSGRPILRPAKTPVTLKHLLTHTCGLCYDFWDEQAFRFSKQTKSKGGVAALPVGPLIFEPGTRWQYGMGIDWAGRLVEEISGMSLEDYFQAKIFSPLEMRDTSFILPPTKFDRLVASWGRGETGVGDLKQSSRKQPAPPKTFNGGGGLYSTAGDYVRFMQMILGFGRGMNKAMVLQPGTVASMKINHIGAATAGKMRSFRPDLSSDVDIQPGATEKWGLGFLINTTAYAGGRSAGSLAWAGLFNTFYWIDPKKDLCAVLLMQYLPFVDPEAVGLLNDFEQAVYAGLRK